MTETDARPSEEAVAADTFVAPRTGTGVGKAEKSLSEKARTPRAEEEGNGGVPQLGADRSMARQTGCGAVGGKAVGAA